MVTRSVAVAGLAPCRYRKQGPKLVLWKEKLRSGLRPAAETEKTYLGPLTTCIVAVCSAMWFSVSGWKAMSTSRFSPLPTDPSSGLMVSILLLAVFHSNSMGYLPVLSSDTVLTRVSLMCTSPKSTGSVCSGTACVEPRSSSSATWQCVSKPSPLMLMASRVAFFLTVHTALKLYVFSSLGMNCTERGSSDSGATVPDMGWIRTMGGSSSAPKVRPSKAKAKGMCSLLTSRTA